MAVVDESCLTYDRKLIALEFLRLFKITFGDTVVELELDRSLTSPLTIEDDEEGTGSGSGTVCVISSWYCITCAASSFCFTLIFDSSFLILKGASSV
jgi:hypothetical protein